MGVLHMFFARASTLRKENFANNSLRREESDSQ